MSDPLEQLRAWLDEAGWGWENGAMVLATADADGRPNARYVLLRGIDGRGLHFYTNYDSVKAEELDANPHAAVVFGFPDPQRQIRARGPVTRASAEESDTYFATRPRGSQLGAWASDQSVEIHDREVLERRLAEAEADFPEGQPVPRPSHWGGYVLDPQEIEFWAGRPNRLHDRELWRRVADGTWTSCRLAP